MILEVPIGGEPIRYEMDKEAGGLVVDRFLYTSMRYPGNDSFIPHTLSVDGDPCDVVASTRAIAHGAVMGCRVVGRLLMEDEAGGDEELIAARHPDDSRGTATRPRVRSRHGRGTQVIGNCAVSDRRRRATAARLASNNAAAVAALVAAPIRKGKGR